MIVGVVITLILYPIAIVLSSMFMFVLILTVWVWMPVVLLVTYVFNLLFFQFESAYVPYGVFIRMAPIPSLLISFIGSLLKIIAISLYLILIAPLGAFLITLLVILIRLIRTVTDATLLFLIRKLGRTPSRNTAIAKKISGPGMSKEYYMSINE